MATNQYNQLLRQVITEIKATRVTMARRVNTSMMQLYWNIGAHLSNKLFDSLSAGKPIIVNSAGWTKDMVEEYNCGYYVNPNKPQELVDKIIHLKENPEPVEKMGGNSRILAETVYDKSILCKQFVQVINSKLNTETNG